MAINLGTIFAQIGLDTSLLRAGVTKSKAQLTKADKSIGGFIKRNEGRLLKFGAIGAGAVAAIGIASIKMAGDFDQAMRNVNTITKLTEDQLNALKEEVIDLSKEVPLTTQELTEGLFNVASAGVEAADQMNFLTTSSRAAVAGQANLGTTVKGITGIIKGYGDEFSNADKVADLFFKTNELGVTTFEELAASMGKVVPIASALGITQEELFASMATLTGVTGNTSEVVTQLKAAFTNLIKPSKEAQEIAKELGISFDATSIQTLGLAGFLDQIKVATGGNVEQMGKLFGSVEGLGAILALTGDSSDKFVKNLGEMDDAAGAATDAFSEQQKGLNNQLKIFKNNISAIAIDIGTDLIPALNNILTTVNELDDEQKELITTGSKFGFGLVGIGSLAVLLAVGIRKLTVFITANGLTMQKFASGPLAQFAVGFLAARQAGEALAPMMEENDRRINSLITVTGSMNDENRIAAIEQRILGDELSTTGGVMARLLGVTEEAIKISNAYGDNLKEEKIAMQRSAEGLRIRTERQKEATEATEEDIEAIEDQTDAINDLLDSIFKLFNLNQDVTEATFDYEDAQIKLNEVLEEYGIGSREAIEATFDLQDARENLIRSIFEEIQAEDISIQRQGELRAEFIKVGKEAVKSGEITEQAFQDMLTEFNNTVSGVELGVARIKQSLSEIPRKITTTIDVIYNQRIVNLPNAPPQPRRLEHGGLIGGFETGGTIRDYQDGGPTSQRSVLVGERGPEIAVLPLGTRISPNNNLGQAIRDNQGGGEITIPVTVNLDGEVLFESIEKVSNVEEFRRIT